MPVNLPKPDGRPETLDEMRRLLKEDEDARRALTGDIAAPVQPDPMAGADGALGRKLHSLNNPTPEADDPTLAARGGDFAGKTGRTLNYTPVELTGDANDPNRLADTKDHESPAPAPAPERPSTDALVQHLPPEPVSAPAVAEPPPDDLADAQGGANRQRLMRELLTAGSMFVKGTTGVDDVAKFAADEKNADIPIDQAIQRIREKRATAADRMALAKALYEQKHGQAVLDQNAKSSAASLEASKARDAEAGAFRSAQLSNNTAALTETARHNRAMESRPVGGPKFGGPTDPSAPPSDIDIRNGLARGDKLGQITGKTSELFQALKSLDDLAPGVTDANPGPEFDGLYDFGDRTALKAPFGLGSTFVSPKTAEFNSKIQQLSDLIMRHRTGAVVNENEMKQYADMLATQVASDPKLLPKVLRDFKQSTYRGLKDKQTPFMGGKVDVLKQYEDNGGTTFRNPFFKSVADPESPAPTGAPDLPTDVPVREPGGAPAPAAAPAPKPFKIEASKVAFAKSKAQPGETVMVSPDGEIEIVPENKVGEARSAGYAAL